MIVRPFKYPDSALFAPFTDIPQRRLDLAAAAAVTVLETASRVKRAHAQTGRSFTERVELEAARLHAHKMQRLAVASLSRSAVVRALLMAAVLYPPLSERVDVRMGGVRTTVTLCMGLMHPWPGETLERLVSRALASPTVVQGAAAILLLPREDQDEMVRALSEDVIALSSGA